MQAELNKYFPTDVSNLILEKHYKTMFNESIEHLNSEIKNLRERFYIDPESSEYESEDYEEFGEHHFMEYYLNKMFHNHRAWKLGVGYDSEDE